MNRIRKSRLTFVLFVVVLAAWLSLSGLWKTVVKLPTTLRNEIHRADYDAYARSRGTTTEKIADEFYQRQVAANEKARVAGQHECAIFWSSGKDCYNRPLRGLPSIKSDIGADDVIEGTKRSLIKASPLLLALIGSILAAITLVYIIPRVLRTFWYWLAPR